MRELNRDVQANHGVLAAIEGAKRHWESLIEEMGGIFAIFNANNSLLFCNENLAGLMGLTTLNYLRHSFTKLLSEEEQSQLENQKKLISEDANLKVTVFELKLQGTDRFIPFLVNLSLFPIETSEGKLFTLFGQDLTDLKSSEQRLSGVFSSIPLGVLTLAQDGKIETRFSDISKDIIGIPDLAGKKLIDTLMLEGKDELFLAEIAAIEKLDSVVGKKKQIFDDLSENLPRELHSVKEDAHGKIVERWISVLYNPILENDVIQRVVVVFEDKTNAVLMERERAKLGLLEDPVVRRLFQVRSISLEYAVTMKNEIGSLMNGGLASIESRTKQDLLRALHALKGNFRAVDFGELSKQAHALEEVALNSSEIGENTWDVIRDQFQFISKEWSAIERTIDFVIHEEQGGQEETTGIREDEYWNLIEETLLKIGEPPTLSGRSFERDLLLMKAKKNNLISLNTLEAPIVEQFRRVLEATGKNAEIHFEWSHILVNRKTASIIREALLHLVNNAVDHGIEESEVREKNHKNPIGSIAIFGKLNLQNRLEIKFVDDGRGISVEKIREKAIARTLVTEEKAKALTSSQILEFIFAPEFSTKEQVSEVSGRGIGLDAVVTALKEINGSIGVESELTKGSKFLISIAPQFHFPIVKQCLTVERFINMMDEMFLFIKQKKMGALRIRPNFSSMGLSSFSILGIDAEKVIFACTFRAVCSYKTPICININRDGGDLTINFSEYQPLTVDSAIKTPPWCSSEVDHEIQQTYFDDVVRQHNGIVQYGSDGRLKLIVFKGAFMEGFKISVALSRAIEPENAQEVLNRIGTVVKRLGGNLNILPNPVPNLDLWVSLEPIEMNFNCLRPTSTESIIENTILNRLSSRLKNAWP